jgi:hypothetical protein
MYLQLVCQPSKYEILFYIWNIQFNLNQQVLNIQQPSMLYDHETWFFNTFSVDLIFHLVLLLAYDSIRANKTMAHVSSTILFQQASHKERWTQEGSGGGDDHHFLRQLKEINISEIFLFFTRDLKIQPIFSEFLNAHYECKNILTYLSTMWKKFILFFVMPFTKKWWSHG